MKLSIKVKQTTANQLLSESAIERNGYYKWVWGGEGSQITVNIHWNWLLIGVISTQLLLYSVLLQSDGTVRLWGTWPEMHTSKQRWCFFLHHPYSCSQILANGDVEDGNYGISELREVNRKGLMKEQDWNIQLGVQVAREQRDQVLNWRLPVARCSLAPPASAIIIC